MDSPASVKLERRWEGKEEEGLVQESQGRGWHPGRQSQEEPHAEGGVARQNGDPSVEKEWPRLRS